MYNLKGNTFLTTALNFLLVSMLVSGSFSTHPIVWSSSRSILFPETLRREMSDAQQGFVIQKVTEKHGKTEAVRKKKKHGPPKICRIRESYFKCVETMWFLRRDIICVPKKCGEVTLPSNGCGPVDTGLENRDAAGRSGGLSLWKFLGKPLKLQPFSMCFWIL